MRAIGDPHLALPDQVQLAHEPPFAIGAVRVTPATRQVSRGECHETLEPRVMQVLVALARAPNGILTRDELAECCWGGRIVGEDAINRVLSRLRQVAAGIGGGSFSVETIRGVGYRLVEDGESGLAAGARAGVSRRTLVAGSAAAFAAAAGGAWLLTRPGHEPLPLAVQYYERGLATRGQASLEQSEQGAALFREATRIDPRFADAWGALAWSYRGLLEFAPSRPDSARLHALSRSAAARALELDADNVEAAAALLLLRPFYRNWAMIERGCRELLERHPENSLLEYNLGFVLCEVGRFEESLPYCLSVARRERFWPLAHYRLMYALNSVGRIVEADDLAEEGLKRFPKRGDFWLARIRQLTVAGRFAEAQAFANDVANRPSEGIEPAIDFEIQIIRALADGSPEARRKALATVEATTAANPFHLPVLAISASILGFPQTSLAMLEGFYFGRGRWASGRAERPQTGFLFGPSARALRALPQFAVLVREIGLAGYWRETGTRPDYLRKA